MTSTKLIFIKDYVFAHLGIVVKAYSYVNDKIGIIFGSIIYFLNASLFLHTRKYRLDACCKNWILFSCDYENSDFVKVAMEELHEKHVKQFQELVQKLDKSPAWHDLLKTHKFDNLRFDVLKECHYQQVLTLLCYQFSMYGNVINHMCFNASVEDSLPRFKREVSFAIKRGTSWVALERKTNRVVAVTTSDDMLAPTDKSSESTFQRMRKKINAKAIQNFPQLCKMLFDEDFKPLKLKKKNLFFFFGMDILGFYSVYVIIFFDV
ncbi:hypothetical protein RFI_30108 [Reticulomyxa filosa]|uniref:Uncharacterized protein n=1 Tax=Reticulomyxa filosa TaxID=46433 RepID=X6M2Q7_RETFI|nr:hypothetical protein RFI_30108 [Reticulomyxa filosa]|eukprot:ETO07285.1 hypothetical protein RFI_30108 [Reticulomyxa filosa]